MVAHGTVKWFDGHEHRSFSGYDRSEDPSAETSTGSNSDTYVREDRANPTPEQLDIARRYDEGEISKEEAESQLDILAAGHDL